MSGFKWMRGLSLVVLLFVLLAPAGCDLPERGGDGYDRGGDGGSAGDDGGGERDWCMTCGGSGYVHYVTTGETEVCPTCHGAGER